eukprot:TsM_000915400 transcript=TsM_000915400 gene=TsM_000915400
MKFNLTRDHGPRKYINCTMLTCSRSSSRACQPSTSTRPRGLRLVTKEEKHGQQHDSLLYSFECLKSALLAKQMSGVKEAAEAMEDSEFNMEFFCDVDALYSHSEETCFEMNRVLNDVHPSHATEDNFSLNLDDPYSKSWIDEIERIISGDHSEEEEVARTRPTKRHVCVGLGHRRTRMRMALMKPGVIV